MVNMFVSWFYADNAHTYCLATWKNAFGWVRDKDFEIQFTLIKIAKTHTHTLTHACRPNHRLLIRYYIHTHFQVFPRKRFAVFEWWNSNPIRENCKQISKVENVFNETPDHTCGIFEFSNGFASQYDDFLPQIITIISPMCFANQIAYSFERGVMVCHRVVQFNVGTRSIFHLFKLSIW